MVPLAGKVLVVASLWLLAVVPVLLIGASVVARVNSADPDKPCADLSGEECDAMLHGASRDFFGRLLAWGKEVLPDATYDVAKIPRASDQSRVEPEFLTMEKAAAGAEIIVRIRVTDVKLSVTDLAMTNAEVVEYWKGSGPERATFGQNAVAFPDANWKPTVLENPLAPFLAPGDEAVLFLRRRSADPNRAVKLENDDVYRVELQTGWYKVEDGRIRVAGEEGEPVASQERFAGIGVDALRALVAEALSAPE